MRLELFTNENELEEYLRVATFSVIADNAIIPIVHKKFRGEITTALNYTKSLRKNFNIGYGPWILYALRNDKNEIVGTICVARDNHTFKTAQLEYIAIRKDHQKQGLGRLLIEKTLEEIKNHSDFKGVILSTNKGGAGFYEKCGMVLAGTFINNKTKRYLFTKQI